jgi:hypothetical protein
MSRQNEWDVPQSTGGASKQHQIGVQSSFNWLAKMHVAQKSGRISTAC